MRDPTPRELALSPLPFNHSAILLALEGCFDARVSNPPFSSVLIYPPVHHRHPSRAPEARMRLDRGLCSKFLCRMPSNQRGSLGTCSCSESILLVVDSRASRERVAILAPQVPPREAHSSACRFDPSLISGPPPLTYVTTLDTGAETEFDSAPTPPPLRFITGPPISLLTHSQPSCSLPRTPSSHLHLIFNIFNFFYA
jgi:hypothetical protein